MTLFMNFALAETPLIEVLIGELKSGDRNTRMKAVRKLSSSEYRENAKVIQPLIKAIQNDENSLVREYAASAVASSDQENSFELLSASLDNPANKGYKQIIQSLSSASKILLPQL
jgi:hypothetical protein